MSLACWLGFHSWEWQKPIEVGLSLYQNAVCTKCGMVRQRNVGWVEDEYIRVGEPSEEDSETT